jgi:hypothetical protein
MLEGGDREDEIIFFPGTEPADISVDDIEPVLPLVDNINGFPEQFPEIRVIMAGDIANLKDICRPEFLQVVPDNRYFHCPFTYAEIVIGMKKIFQAHGIKEKRGVFSPFDIDKELQAVHGDERTQMVGDKCLYPSHTFTRIIIRHATRAFAGGGVEGFWLSVPYARRYLTHVPCRIYSVRNIPDCHLKHNNQRLIKEKRRNNSE